MRAAQLMADLTRLGIRLEAHGDRLRYSPRSAVTPELVDRMKAHKPELLAMLQPEGDESRERRQLVELIQRKGGTMTPRALMRSSRHWATATDSEAALEDLAKSGYGRWVIPPTSTKGGRPTRVFVLNGSADVDTTPTKPSKNSSCVNVDGVNAPSDDDWGEL